MSQPILRLESVTKRYPIGRRKIIPGLGVARESIRAVTEVSIEVSANETLGIVGESGCGKSTLARLMVGLEEPSEGRIVFNSDDVSSHRNPDMRRRIQMIFQDPYSSLNPRVKIGDAIAEALRVHRIAGRSQVNQRVDSLLDAVGLGSSYADRYPIELSGGQRQRVGIARALAVEPEVLIADEAVSGLDVSIQAQILNLLRDIKVEFGLTLVFISHDLSVIDYLADRVAVMYLGRIMEVGTTEAVFDDAAHHYTAGLVASRPSPDPRERSATVALRGEIPSPVNPPSGCVFRTRCPAVRDRCAEEIPVPRLMGEDRLVACHFPRG